jgi:hypothetical protein
MTLEDSSSARAQQLVKQLRDTDARIAQMTALTERLHAELTELEVERQTIVNELMNVQANLKDALADRILEHVGTGMTARETARELNHSHAVVSRIVERAKAAKRKKP